jgi:hypothetical protein
VGFAIRDYAAEATFQILQDCPTSADCLVGFQTHLEALCNSELPVVDFTAEKFVAYDIIQRTFTDDGNGSGHIPSATIRQMHDPSSALKSLFTGVPTGDEHLWRSLDRHKTTALIYSTHILAQQLAQKSPGTLYAESIDPNDVFEELTAENPFVAMLTGNYPRMMEIAYRSRGRQDALLTTVAILRCHTQTGRFPPSLESLRDDGLLTGLPPDPYSESPFMYRLTDTGFTLYSLGPDFDDDGGRHADWSRKPADGDYVFWPPQS